MKNRVIPLGNYSPDCDAVILLDTNILINIFMPYKPEQQKECANLWAKLKKKQPKLIISAIQISEFINRCIRIEYDLYKQVNPQREINFKKDYRSTKDYTEKMDEILSVVTSDIVPNFEFVDDGFSEIQNENIFIRGVSYDFNDALLVEIAKKYKATLVTNDVDFCNYKMDLPIVTSNNLLLNMRC